MITEDYVSYEVAKLLKEKGFYTPYCYSYYFPELKSKTPSILNRVIPKDTDKYLAPTLQMAMKWLREVYNIHIYTFYANGWTFAILDLETGEEFTRRKDYSSEEAAEEAIKYCLTNLIK